MKEEWLGFDIAINPSRSFNGIAAFGVGIGIGRR